ARACTARFVTGALVGLPAASTQIRTVRPAAIPTSTAMLPERAFPSGASHLAGTQAYPNRPLANEFDAGTDFSSTAGTSRQERSARCSEAPTRHAQPYAAAASSGAPATNTRSSRAARNVAILSVRRRSGLASSPSRHARRRARFLMPLMLLVPFLAHRHR